MGIWQTLRRAFGGGEPGFVPAAKAADVVATRFVLLALVAELGVSVTLELDGERDAALTMRKRTLDRLLALGFTPADLEERERDFVMSLRDGRVDPDHVTAATWRLECAAVLAWALRLEERILPIEESADLASLLARVPTDATALQAFVASAGVRPIGELLAARHEWSTRWFSLEGAPPSEERSRVLERARAIRWLTEPALVELSTTNVFE